MRNLFFGEKLLLLGLIGFPAFMAWESHNVAGGILLAAIVALLTVVIVLTRNSTARTVRSAIAHPNNRYASVLEGSGIGLAYAKDGEPAMLRVYSGGSLACFEPHQLRSVGLEHDRKQVLRNILLMVKDADRPERYISFRNTTEAKQWKERITQFAESGGRA